MPKKQNNKVNCELVTLAQKASELMSPCRICPRSCGCDRNSGETGFCGVGSTSRICKELVHYTEESELVPTFSVYFSGCNMRCEYCSNALMLKPENIGIPVDHQALAQRVDHAVKNGSKTLFFLGGEPACSLYDIIMTMAYVKSPVPVVWNSNMYISSEAFDLVMEISDVFLGDLKFGCDSCAMELACTSEYLETVQRNIKAAYDAGKRVIIRHLPMSGHFDCCTKPVLEWVASSCPDASLGLISLLAPVGSELQLPSPEESLLIEGTITGLGLKRVGYGITPGLPDVGVKSRSVESLLHIRKDGSVAVQDTPGDILDILKKITGQL